MHSRWGLTGWVECLGLIRPSLTGKLLGSLFKGERLNRGGFSLFGCGEVRFGEVSDQVSWELSLFVDPSSLVYPHLSIPLHTLVWLGLRPGQVWERKRKNAVIFRNDNITMSMHRVEGCGRLLCCRWDRH